MPTQKQLRALLEYREGKLIWRKCNLRGKRHAGQIAGARNPSGYYHVFIAGKQYRLHRLIWTYHHGHLESALHIDHINRNPSDNRIENLRAVTPEVNYLNRRVTNPAVYPGVYKRGVRRDRWEVQLKRKGRVHHIGRFDTLAAAKHARDLAERAYLQDAA